MTIPFDWLDAGFWTMPARVTVQTTLVAWRVWGGVSRELPGPEADGVFLSGERVASRSEAEQRLAVMEYGNAGRFVTRFRIVPGTPIWLGTVHPGETATLMPGVPGSQILVERDHRDGLLQDGPAVALLDDLPGRTVVPRRVAPGHVDA